jgi:hypothetical protein
MNRLYGPRQSWSFSRRCSQSFRDRDITGAIVSRAGLEPLTGYSTA